MLAIENRMHLKKLSKLYSNMNRFIRVKLDEGPNRVIRAGPVLNFHPLHSPSRDQQTPAHLR